MDGNYIKELSKDSFSSVGSQQAEDDQREELPEPRGEPGDRQPARQPTADRQGENILSSDRLEGNQWFGYLGGYLVPESHICQLD